MVFWVIYRIEVAFGRDGGGFARERLVLLQRFQAFQYLLCLLDVAHRRKYMYLSMSFIPDARFGHDEDDLIFHDLGRVNHTGVALASLSGLS